MTMRNKFVINHKVINKYTEKKDKCQFSPINTYCRFFISYVSHIYLSNNFHLVFPRIFKI